MSKGAIVRPKLAAKIAPDENSTWRGLFAAVVLQAIADLRSDDLCTAIDAAVFLTSRGIGLWLEGAGFPFVRIDLLDMPRAWKYMNKQRNLRWRAYRKVTQGLD